MQFDLLFHYVRSLGGRLAFFRHGWGEFKHQQWLQAVKDKTLPSPQPLEFCNFKKHAIGYEATFVSPTADYLPPESAMGRVWIVEPSFAYAATTRPSPVVVHLAATGDHGPYIRYALFAKQLAKFGITSVILENAFYGKRRPAHQSGAKLGTVAQLADLGRATVEEACGILTYWMQRDGTTRLALSGVSQGGLHAAMAASLCPFPVHCIMSLAPASAAPVFTRDCLSTAVDWNALTKSAPPSSFAGDGFARTQLERVLEASATILNFPESKAHTSRHILLAAENDCYVGRDAIETWIKARPQLELRWLPGGHITAVAFHSSRIREATLDALGVRHTTNTVDDSNETWRFW